MIYLVATGEIKISKYTPEEVYKEKVDKQEVDMLSHKANTLTIKPGEIFGDFSCINLSEQSQIGVRKYAYALEDPTEILVIDTEQLAVLYQQCMST